MDAPGIPGPGKAGLPPVGTWCQEFVGTETSFGQPTGGGKINFLLPVNRVF